MDQRPVVMRCRFSKTGPIRFISHLDLTRTFHRALARAGIPIRFSEGFSPHPRFTFALPLSVGAESRCEIADFQLQDGAEMTPEEVRDRLQAQMPAGIIITSAEIASEKLNRVAFARYEVLLPQTPAALAPAVTAALRSPLTVEKKNKKGKPVTKEISSGIRRFAVAERDGGLLLDLVLGAGGDTVLGPDTVLQALEGAVDGFDRGARRVTRLALLREDETIF